MKKTPRFPSVRQMIVESALRELVNEEHAPGERWYRAAVRSKDGWESSFDVDAMDEEDARRKAKAKMKRGDTIEKMYDNGEYRAFDAEPYADFHTGGDADRFDLRWVDAWGGDEEGSWDYNETRHVADIEVGRDEPDEAIVDKANAKLFDGGQPPEGFGWENDGDVWELKDLETGEPKYVIVPMDY